jgi:hypothetical protein
MAVAKRILNVVQPESTKDIEARISERFEILDIISAACCVGNCRSMIVSGPAGLGKSFTVEANLNKCLDMDQYTIIKGYVRPTGLLKLLYRYRNDNNVVVFDDADSILMDDVGLNLIKAVCDTTERRIVSWLSEGMLFCDETGERIPKSFEFRGSVIFISNIDFQAAVDKKHKSAPHLEALMSRSHYIDLTLKSKQDYLVRIKQVIKGGMLSELSDVQKKSVIKFIDDNYENMRELSLRSAIKLSNLIRSNPKWERIARITMCRS